MIKFEPAAVFKKITSSKYVRQQALKLFVTVALFILIPSIVDLRLAYTQPPISKSTVKF